MMKCDLLCAKHAPDGKRWYGDICCKDCNRVFQTADEATAHFAPEVCPCGVRLMPISDVERALLGVVEGPDYSARAICHECFVERTA